MRVAGTWKQSLGVEEARGKNEIGNPRKERAHVFWRRFMKMEVDVNVHVGRGTYNTVERRT